MVFDCSLLYVRGGPKIYFHGQFQGKTDLWADIQMFAQRYSEKDDLFITPPYLINFGIYSLRATLGDWTEGGNGIYLDIQFNQQWFDRMRDLRWNTKDGAKSGYDSLSTEEVVAIAKKYHAAYIVTEKPKGFKLLKIYENPQFILYEVPGIRQPPCR